MNTDIKTDTEHQPISKPKSDQMIWIEAGFLPIEIAFCPSKKAWDRHVARLVTGEVRQYPDTPGMATTFYGDSWPRSVVTVGNTEGISTAQIIGLLAHEATHVFQQIKQQMRETEPSIEFEAYTIGGITQGLVNAYQKTRGFPAWKE